MKNILLLISVLLSSLFYAPNIYGTHTSETYWRPTKRSYTLFSTVINEQVLQFHFNIPTEKNLIQIYDQSGQLIFEDCFSTLSSADYQVSLADFSAGSYTVYYSDGESKISELLIIDE